MVPSKVLPQMRFRLEYAPVWLLANLMRRLPRPLVRAICISLALLIYVLHGRLGQVGMRNLDLAFPGRSVKQKKRILRGVFTSWDGSSLSSRCSLAITGKMSPGS